jgi:hypothetical protein
MDDVLNMPAEIVRVSEQLDKLATLDDPDAIALELEAQGVKAEIGGAFSCAIARYLGNAVTELDGGGAPKNLMDGTVAVCSSYVSVYRAGVDTYRIPVPHVVGSFIRSFDQSKYPALVAADDERPWEAA